MARRAVSVCCHIVLEAAVVQAQLERLVAPSLQASTDDAREHLARLLRPGFVTAAGVGRVDDVLRYVRGIGRRLEKVAADARRDQERARSVQALERRYARVLESLPPSQVTPEIRDIRWMLEELRVSEFAQVLGTKGTVSARRIEKALDSITHT